MSTRDENTFRVWVGCLACYNSGHLVGEWFDAADCPQGEDEFNEAIPAHVGIAAKDVSPHEELWVFDHENSPVSGEYSPMDAAQYAEWLEGVDDPEALRAWLANDNDFDEDAADKLQESFAGRWESVSDWIWEQFGDEREYPLPAWAESHRGAILKSLQHDMECGGEFWTAHADNGDVLIFRSY